MKKLTGIVSFLLVFGVVLFSNVYANLPENPRKINIGGVIIDSKTKQPIANADIIDENNDVIASTNDEGYFFVTLETPEKGEINFSFLVKKKGYREFVQKEHWADLKNSGGIYYMGIRKKMRINDDSFSKMLPVKMIT